MCNYIKATDSSKNDYIEVEVQPGIESLRATLVKEGYNGKPCIRFNIRPHGQHLRMGPEFSVDYAPQIIAGLMDLITEHENT